MELPASCLRMRKNFQRGLKNLLSARPIPKRVRNSLVRAFSNANEAFRSYAVGSRMHRFLSIFKVWPRTVSLLAELLLPSGTRVDRKGTFGSELAMLNLLCRLGGHFVEWGEQAHMFGIDAGTLNAHFQVALTLVDDQHKQLLDPVHSLERFTHRAAAYEEAVRVKFARKNDNETLRPYFAGVNVLMDGLRQNVSRPSDNQTRKALWSGYVKGACLLWGGLVAPDGLILGLWGTEDGEPLSGRHSDPSFVTDNLLVALQLYGFHVLCDGIFRHQEGIVTPLPKRKSLAKKGLVKEDSRKMSGMRVPVEWTFGRLQEMFKMPFMPEKSKVYASKVCASLRVAAIIYNLVVCSRGSQVTKYFRMRPPKARRYLSAATL
jgi:hypothetical protein